MPTIRRAADNKSGNEFIEELRQRRYLAETDAMRLKADEDYSIGSEEWLAAMEAWKIAKQSIRWDLPYGA